MWISSVTLLLLDVLLVGLTTADSEVKKVQFPGGSRPSKALVKYGLARYIIPLFKNDRSDFKQFSETEVAKLQASRDQLVSAANRASTVAGALKLLISRFRQLRQDCNTTLRNLCPKCLSERCKRRAEECPQPTFLQVIAEMANKALNPCECPPYDPNCEFGNVFCSPDALQGIVGTLRNSLVTPVLDIGEQFVNTLKDIDVRDTLDSVGDLVTDGIPDFIINSIGETFDNEVFDKIKTAFENPESILSDNLKDLGDISFGDIGSKLEDFIADDIGIDLGGIGDTLGDIGDKLGDFDVGDLDLGLGDIADSVGDFFGGGGGGWGKRKKRSVHSPKSVPRPAVRHIFRHRHVQKRSVREPTCDELKQNPQEACKAYIHHSDCERNCKPDYVCPGFRLTLDEIKKVNSSYISARQAIFKANVSLNEKVRVYKEKLQERRLAFCWGSTFSSHHSGRTPSRPWYNVLKVVAYKSGDQYLNVTAVVDMGSDLYRYEGNIVFQRGFNPLNVDGAKAIVKEALVWYKMKLRENGVCG